ncbi:MAG: SDR family oxidoreductase [Comamonas sp.]
MTAAVRSLVFITGASSGIGQALAARFYAEGHDLALVARSVQAMQDWTQAKGWEPARYAIYGADVSVADSIVAAGLQCIERQGLPQVVVANAGVSWGVDTAEREDLEVMAQLFATNNLGMAASFHPFIRAMQARGSGTLVGLASVAAIRGLPGHGAYCASKAGVVAYCESLRGELRASGVRVVTLLPGYVATPLTRENRYPMPFLLTADDFARRACRTILRQTSYAVIPWQMGIVAKLLRVLPNAVFDRLLQGRKTKQRHQPER